MRKDKRGIYLIKMKKEDQNVSVEMAQEMKELGAKQDSLFWWVKHIKSGTDYRIWDLVFGKDENDLVNKYVSAYSVAELGEMLPAGFYSYFDKFDGWTCSSPRGFCNSDCDEEIVGETSIGTLRRPKKTRLWEEAKTEVDTRAKMWIFLKNERIL